MKQIAAISSWLALAPPGVSWAADQPYLLPVYASTTIAAEVCEHTRFLRSSRQSKNTSSFGSMQMEYIFNKTLDSSGLRQRKTRSEDGLSSPQQANWQALAKLYLCIVSLMQTTTASRQRGAPTSSGDTGRHKRTSSYVAVR
jgi:hypothetical protein